MSAAEPPADGYLAPSAPARAELSERGSRFLATLVPVTDPEEAQRALAAAAERDAGATHHCWAWRLGAAGAARSSDAGEPRGTAGAPILAALGGAGVSDALVVVSRWFGGVKLGRGGLVRAYAGAARAAIAAARLEPRLPTTELAIEAPFAAVGAIKRMVRPPEVALLSEEYGELARFVLAVADARRSEVEAMLRDLGARLR